MIGIDTSSSQHHAKVFLQCLSPLRFRLKLIDSHSLTPFHPFDIPLPQRAVPSLGADNTKSFSRKSRTVIENVMQPLGKLGCIVREIILRMKTVHWLLIVVWIARDKALPIEYCVKPFVLSNSFFMYEPEGITMLIQSLIVVNEGKDNVAHAWRTEAYVNQHRCISILQQPIDKYDHMGRNSLRASNVGHRETNIESEGAQ
mmetsp:Transcript_12447/g.21563  ORF Transcript_12447/g.21563 Transcript_12447/m.21563 type:complete len:201 (+) Transcript_12447:308-910(+)|eukprot:CAMPEP_0183787408 /NCGR_PEP_ID=MMETSP0739-20130205/67529_1 /TAXON_ID=385413 /ORGANISM="Thalassiosira miniscula, Strain CCMP1093" /LENGTH=200 /DNA_ID=CAMNT_0026031491 /DNA_START=284 /DNA_END=886 /DNA_ORIENTATION=+